MGKRKLQKLEANAKLSWAEWLLDRKETLTLQDETVQNSNFIPHDHSRQGFAGIPGPTSPGVLPRALPKKAKHQKTSQ